MGLTSGRGGRGTRRRGFRVRSTHVPVLAVIAAVASLAVVAAAVGVTHALTGRTAADAPPAVDMHCTLIVPANPLSPQGLATLYQLTATDPAAGPPRPHRGACRWAGPRLAPRARAATGSTGGGDAARLTDSYGVLGARRSASRFP